MPTIAVLGANGRLSRLVAKAFLDAGYRVIAVTRAGELPAGLAGAEARAADAMQRDALVAATAGAEIIFNGLNPPYTEWASKCLPMAGNVVAALRAHGAAHYFPGNVYNFGSPMPLVLTEDLPFRPTTRKGRIRVEMEALFREAAHRDGIPTLVLRAGDYFGGPGRGAWFDLVVTARIGKGIYTAPGPENLVHEWAYLPDLAQAFVRLAAVRERFGGYENLHFPGHAVTDLQMKAAVERALGRPLKLSRLPWWGVRAVGLVVPIWREIAEMAYLRFEPHRLVSARLEELIGTVPHTPLESAVRDALAALSLVGTEERGPAAARRIRAA